MKTINPSRLVFCALCISLSIVLEKVLSITAGAIRISIGNFPVIFIGLLYGPLAGSVVGCLSDVLGSILVGYSINPIITLGATAVGFISGITSNSLREMTKHSSQITPSLVRRGLKFNIIISSLLAHAIGNILIKSIGLRLYYGYTYALLALRIPIYVTIAIIEAFLISVVYVAISPLKQKGRV